MQYTQVGIRNGVFYINGQPTYPGTPAEGRLMNIRAANGIFDDRVHPGRFDRPEFVHRSYHRWDPEANTDRLIEALPKWKWMGIRALTVNVQGGWPGVPNETVDNNPYSPDGRVVDAAYVRRMDRLIRAADAQGMGVIVGYFYFGQAHRIPDESAVKESVVAITRWLVDQGFTNVLVEINNEYNVRYTHPILQEQRVLELIELARRISEGRLLISTSPGGGTLPSDAIIASSDFILLHGNGCRPDRLRAMIRAVRGKTLKPIVVNEDPEGLPNLNVAFEEGASWGYYSQEDKQDVPARWTILPGQEARILYRIRELVQEPVEGPVMTKQHLVEGLRDVGIRPGMLLQVHSSLSRFGYVEGGADTVVDALLEAVGPEGTVMLPTFNHSAAAIFDLQRSPSTNGMITEAFRRRPETKRSMHPTHPYAAIGPLAEPLVQGHLETLTFGPECPLGKLARWGGTILLLGVKMNVNTCAHIGETIAGVHCLGYREAPRRVRLPDGEVVEAWSTAWRNGPCRIEWDTLEERMRDRGMIQDGHIGPAEVHCMKAQDVVDVVLVLTRELCPTCPTMPRPEARDVERER